MIEFLLQIATCDVIGAGLASDPSTILIAAVEEANRTHWSRSVKFEYFVIIGAIRKMLHVWFRLV